MEQKFPFLSFYIWRKYGLEGLDNFFKITQIVSVQSELLGQTTHFNSRTISLIYYYM